MKRIFGYFFMICIAFNEFIGGSTQEQSDSTQRHTAIAAPERLSVGAISQSDEQSVFVGWLPLPDIHSYNLRLYTSEDDILEREITNLKYSAFLITDLDDGTDYYVTVSASYENRRGTLVESRESPRVHFRTTEKCTGGQTLTPCNGHCHAMCDNPDPVCPRICKRGCACPLNRNIWHEGKCIVSESCPTQIGIPVRVTGLSAVESRVPGSDVLLTWDFNPDANVYEVKVRLATNTSVVVQTLEVIIPVATISNLVPFEVYTFTVRAFVRRPPMNARSALLAPLGVIVSNVDETSFTVTWFSNTNAVRYSFALFDDTKENILYENRKLAGNSVEIEDLQPGTEYYFALAAAGPQESIGQYGSLTRVVTLGENQGLDVAREETVVMAVKGRTTTAKPRTSGNTACLQEYERVDRLYEDFPNASGGPRYPSCDEDGLYVTTLCETEDTSVCWCITADEGEKRIASDFGGTNSDFPLDCDRYGVLEVDNEIELRIIQAHSSSIEVEWDTVPEAYSYILYIGDQNGAAETTFSLNENVRKHTLSQLHQGTEYVVGLYVVDSTGGSSSMTIIEVTTAPVDTPENLKVLSNTADQLTVTWKVDPNAEGFNVRLIDSASDEVVQRRNNVVYDRITFSGLEVQSKYIVEVRAFARPFANEGSEEGKLYISEPATVEVIVQCSLPPVDIIFAFDISRAMTWAGLQATKNLAANLLAALPPIEGTNGTRVAAVRYQHDARAMFHYTRYKQTANAAGGIRFLRYAGSPRVHVGNVLNLLQRQFFTSPPNRNYMKRKNALSVVVVFSAGTSEDTYTSEATRLKFRSNVMTVGVLGHSNRSQMRSIASKPNLNIVATSFANLEDASDILLQRMCTLVSR